LEVQGLGIDGVCDGELIGAVLGRSWTGPCGEVGKELAVFVFIATFEDEVADVDGGYGLVGLVSACGLCERMGL
jgi:hypothetical protein